MEVKFPPLCRNPCWLPLVSTYNPTMSPLGLMPSTAVLTAPGKSTVVKTGWFWANAVPKNSAELIRAVRALLHNIGPPPCELVETQGCITFPEPPLRRLSNAWLRPSDLLMRELKAKSVTRLQEIYG